MFLIAPTAWGETTEGLSTFVGSVQRICRNSYVRELAVWRGISFGNRDLLAKSLCEDDRVFWPFAEGQFGEEATHFEESFRNKPNFGPLVVGLVGGSPRETSEILHALRTLLYPTSNSILQWTGDRGKLREWKSNARGGLFGGVIEVKINGDTESQRLNHIDVANDAMSYTMAHHMDSFVLVLSSREDIRKSFPTKGNPIKWVSLETSDCDRILRF